jgi:3-oxoacyl-[acyl-carrier protein] reductase
MITYTSTSSESKVERLISKIASLNNGSSASAVKADLALPASAQQIVDATLAAFSTSTIDILVNNAAISHVKHMVDVTQEDYDSLYAVNVRAPFFLTQIVRKHLPKEGGGRIINISSVAGRGDAPGFSVYGSTKAAVEGLTRSWASEFGREGHTVNAVAPAATQSDMMDQLDADFLDQERKATPMGRLATGEDIANVVSWLASEESGWITGQTISASGGFKMY